MIGLTPRSLVGMLLEAIAADTRGEAVVDADLFDEHMSPLKIAFWHIQLPPLGAADEIVPLHYLALRTAADGDSHSQDETTSLSYEWRLILAGRRDLFGRPCLCRHDIKWPEASRGGDKRGDSRSALVGLLADLERAADSLPIPWTVTREIFRAQGREDIYDIRLAACRLFPLRPVDAEREPIDGRGRPHSRGEAYRRMAIALGWTPKPVQGALEAAA